MLATADRHNSLLVGQVRQSHPDLYHPVTQAKLEQEEAPRFAIYLSDEDIVLLTTDPDMGVKISLEDYERLYWSSQTTPMKYRVPPLLAVTTECFLNELRSAGLLHWTFWQMEQATMTHGLGFAVSKVPAMLDEVGFQPATADTNRERASFWMVCIDRLKALTKVDDVIESTSDMLQDDAPIKGLKATLSSVAPSVTQDLLQCVDALKKSRYRAAGLRRWSWRQPSILWRGKEHLILRKWFNKQAAFPRADFGVHNVGILVKSASDVSLEVLSAIMMGQTETARLHLFILEASSAQIGKEMSQYVDSISFLNIPDFDDPASRKMQFFGAFLSAPKAPSANDKAMGLLYWLDELHNYNCPAASRLMGALRRFGMTTSLYFKHHQGAEVFNDIRRTLAYEYTYQNLVVPDLNTADYLRSMGIPASKVKVLEVPATASVEASPV